MDLQSMLLDDLYLDYPNSVTVLRGSIINTSDANIDALDPLVRHFIHLQRISVTTSHPVRAAETPSGSSLRRSLAGEVTARWFESNPALFCVEMDCHIYERSGRFCINGRAYFPYFGVYRWVDGDMIVDYRTDKHYNKRV